MSTFKGRQSIKGQIRSVLHEVRDSEVKARVVADEVHRLGKDMEKRAGYAEFAALEALRKAEMVLDQLKTARDLLQLRLTAGVPATAPSSKFVKTDIVLALGHLKGAYDEQAKVVKELKELKELLSSFWDITMDKAEPFKASPTIDEFEFDFKLPHGKDSDN